MKFDASTPKYLLPPILLLASLVLLPRTNATPPSPIRGRHLEPTRLLVIQAEDLGMAHSIDEATFDAVDKGWVTTGNALVPGPWFPEVAQWYATHADADLGLELDLNSDWLTLRWRPIGPTGQETSLVDALGYFPVSDYFAAAHDNPVEAGNELRAQIQTAEKFGVHFTHLDNHMHTMLLSPALFSLYWKLGQESGVPVVLPRQFVRARGIPSGQKNVYHLAGVELNVQDLAVDQLLEIKPGFTKRDWLDAYENALRALPPGTYLLSVHLGFSDDELKAMTAGHPNWGAQWRQNDYDVISSPEFHKFLKDQGFILVSWKDLEKRPSETH